jgi:chromosome segregation ATPase
MLIGSALVVSGVLGSYWYVKSLESKLQLSQTSISNLQQGINTQKNTITAIQAEAKTIARTTQEYNQRLQNQNQEIRELNNKFTKSANNRERDLGNLASQRPQLIENIINRATAQARRCMEIAMGAEPTEQEKNDPKLAKDFENCNN